MGDEMPKEGEVLPREKEDQEGESDDNINIYTQIISSIRHYTDRPDLLLDVVERHDPGFIRRMNDYAQEYSERVRSSRFYFGKRQAYTALAIRSMAAPAIVGTVFYSVYSGSASFWIIVALGLFYAVTQSGTSGFSRLTQAISNLIERHFSGGDKN